MMSQTCKYCEFNRTYNTFGVKTNHCVKKNNVEINKGDSSCEEYQKRKRVSKISSYEKRDAITIKSKLYLKNKVIQKQIEVLDEYRLEINRKDKIIDRLNKKLKEYEPNRAKRQTP